ncbi:MAG: hypothetical protein ACR2ML_01510 [Solirubrobacteraceae bacterium]
MHMRSDSPKSVAISCKAALRRWLGRPLREQSPALLAALVGLLLVGAIVAVAGGGSDPEPRPDLPPAPAPLRGEEPAAPAPDEDGSAQETLDAANQTAQAFLDEYLPFVYGQGALPRTGLTPGLRESLRRDYESRRARVPPAQLALRPEVVSLNMSGTDPAQRLDAEALVDDGSGTRYPVRMTLRPVDGVWRVTDLGR